MKITACAIMRNEAAHVEKWLAAARGYADRMLVVDTGSTDATRELAAAGGAEVLDFPWRDDFAAAKNFALAHAERGADWLTFLDADEVFVAPAKVREVLASQAAETFALAVPLLNLSRVENDEKAERKSSLEAEAALRESGQWTETSRFPAVRIFRAGVGLRYVGRVHEQLLQRGQIFTPHFEPRLEIYHTGYDGGLAREKCERNLKLLREVERRGESLLVYRYLADALYGLGDYEEAERYARKAIAVEPPTVDGKQGLYLLVLDAMQAGGRPLLEQLSFAQETRRAHPEYVDFLAREGILLWRLGRHREAAALFAQFLTALEESSLAQGAGTSTAQSLVPPVKTCLREWQAEKRWQSMTQAEQYERAVQLGAQDVPLLFAGLFCGETQEGRETLPTSMQRVLAYARGEQIELLPEDEDGYRAGLGAILTYAPREKIADYAVLSAKFGWKCVCTVAEKLLAAEEWEMAFALLSEVPADAIGDAAVFWRQVGISLYHLPGQEAAAREALTRAQAAGSEARDIPAYLAWLDAREKGGGARG